MRHIIIDRIIAIQEEVEPRSRSAFEVIIGKKSGYLNTMDKRGSIPSANLIKNIIEIYPQFNLYWIMGLSINKYVKEEKETQKLEKEVIKIVHRITNPKFEKLNNNILILLRREMSDSELNNELKNKEVS